MMAAMMIGTAISAGASPAAEAERQNQDSTASAVNDLSKYCQACWRNARLPVDRWPDCTQQVFARLLERVEPMQWATLLQSEGNEKREFLRAIDAVKKQIQRSRRFLELGGELADQRNRTSDSVRDQWEAVNRVAETVLSPRQKQIVELSATGWNVPDIAAQLGTTPERISDEKYKAIRKLREELGTLDD
jgi:DNA-directed RNA polymerase specialized sigma24 family protein